MSYRPFRNLNKCFNLKSLKLRYINWNIEICELINQLFKLRYLNIKLENIEFQNGINDRIVPCQNFNLTALCLNSILLKESNIELLSLSCPNLKYFRMDSCIVNEQDLREALRKWSDLECLEINEGLYQPNFLSFEFICGIPLSILRNLKYFGLSARTYDDPITVNLNLTIL